jgi:hypothetical protein
VKEKCVVKVRGQESELSNSGILTERGLMEQESGGAREQF